MSRDQNERTSLDLFFFFFAVLFLPRASISENCKPPSGCQVHTNQQTPPGFYPNGCAQSFSDMKSETSQGRRTLLGPTASRQFSFLGCSANFKTKKKKKR